jgi:hypothetical protein
VTEFEDLGELDLLGVAEAELAATLTQLDDMTGGC